jgi:S1-C subfamily serine protease
MRTVVLMVVVSLLTLTALVPVRPTPQLRSASSFTFLQNVVQAHVVPTFEPSEEAHTPLPLHKLFRSVGRLVTDREGGSCSCARVKHTSYLISAAHCAKSSDETTEVIFPRYLTDKVERGTSAPIHATPVYVDVKNDISIFYAKTLPQDDFGLELSDKEPGLGQRGFQFGYPITGGLNLTMDVGTMAGIVSIAGEDTVKWSINVAHGNSGGPILNSKGKIIGLSVAGWADRAGLIAYSPRMYALRAAFNFVKHVSAEKN